MTLQEVFSLDDCDYSTNHSVEVIQKKLQSLLVVLTPHKSQSSDINFIKAAYSKTGTGFIKITPRDFLKKEKDFLKNIDLHLLVEDYDLMDPFGYSECINLIKDKGYFFIFLKYKGKGIPLNFNKYTVKSSTDDYFYYLYILILKYPTSIVLCKNVHKLRMFCQILNLNIEVDTDYKAEYEGRICLVVEEYKEIESSIVIYIGMGTYKNINLKDDFKIKYRIRDLVRCLSKEVVSGRRKMNFERFRDILRRS